MPFGFRRGKEKKGAEKEKRHHHHQAYKNQNSSPVHSHGVDNSARNRAASASPIDPNSSSARELREKLGLPERSKQTHSLSRTDSGMKVAQQKAFFEELSKTTSTNSLPQSPEKHNSKKMDASQISVSSSNTSTGRISISVSSPVASSEGSGKETPTLPGNTPSRSVLSGSSDHSSMSSQQLGVGSSTNSVRRRSSFFDYSSPTSPEMDRDKEFPGTELPLPPLRTMTVRLRDVEARRNAPGGGFGFILRKSYLPVPEDPDRTRLVHLVEPRSDYFGPLMTGDRIIEVQGENVEDDYHESVVEMIKASGDAVYLKVASMPELLELNSRGALDDPLQRSSKLRKSGKGKAKQGTGTLRRQAKNSKFKAKTEEEVLSERQGLQQELVWIVHKSGFTLGTLVQDSPKRNAISNHATFIRQQGREVHRVKVADTGEVIEVEEEDLEKANSFTQDKVEDLVDLVNLNESGALHVLRQRYASSLIHTFAGRHLIVLNPLRPLSSYVDRVIDMFRGCRREDMPPHIFAMGQQAYRSMMVTRQDQSLILMGLSGSGKTFNARYLLRYLTTIGQPEFGPVSNAKLDAVELLLHSFGSAATILNPQATRCTCLYSLNFDPSGTVVGASVQTYYLERNRVAQRPNGEGNFNIFYQLIAGADDQLRSDLLLNAAVESDEPNLYFRPLEDQTRVESAAYVWELIQNCLEILGISREEAMALWSLLAAIYHLGYAGVRKGQVRGSDCFMNPSAAQRAAAILGIDHEALGKDIFSPPRSGTLRVTALYNSPLGSLTASSPTTSDSTSITSSLFLANLGGNRSVFLDAFVTGLYDQAFNALVMLINRALNPQTGSHKGRSRIHVVDTPGFQHRELAGAQDGASFDDLCINYAQERLQMLFHDSTFTSEQDRYLQEEINWMFSEVAASPLSLIDTIDKHVPQRRGGAIDLHTDRRGIFWILDEESVFPGASDSSFLDRVHMYHGNTGKGQPPVIKVIKEDNQFILHHCQHSLPVLYDANGWVRRAREHPSFRVVVQIMAESKSDSIACVFQGRGVAASATSLGTSQLKVDTHHRSLSRTTSTQAAPHYNSPTTGIKKSSVCLQTKFQLDSLIDVLRKSKQWFIRCILPQLPHKLPGALPGPDSSLREHQEDEIGESVTHGHINVPLVRAQIRRAELVKAARIYKQGFPEHMSYSQFRRRYGALVPFDDGTDASFTDKDSAEYILASLVDKHAYKTGLSQAFLRAGTLTALDRQVEERTHSTMVLFQARCRGWLGRQKFQTMQVQDAAAVVIQDNVLAYLELRDWSWWKLYLKVKPMLAIWRAEEEIKDRESKIEKLKTKVESLENERDMLKESEANMEAKVTQMSAQLGNVMNSANEASDLMENEQLEKRELEEKLNETTAHEAELKHENEQLQLQIAEMSILARLNKQSEDGEESSDTVLEKYWETKRELETLRQRVGSEFEDEIERLESAKRSVEKKLADSESERDDLHRTLASVRKKAAKLGQEMNDLKLHLEAQQSRNAELEKRQRKFDADLSAAKEESTVEVQAKDKLAKEMDMLRTEHSELKDKFKELKEENKQICQEKEDLEAEILSNTTATTESELTSVKRMKRDLETKVEELEDELDEANIKLDTIQQAKVRLELSNQTLKQQHQKELEGRDEELEQIKSTMNKKIKSLGQQLEEMHEEKQSAVKARRDLERELLEYQSKLGDPEMEKKLRKMLRKYKALLEDTQEQLEHEREMRSNSAMVKSLRNQLEDLQASETNAVKSQKRIQAELDELMVQNDELTRVKIELESRVSDLSREKDDLESRIEEDQDEIEELLDKQRSHISQISSLQSQSTEANLQVQDLQETKLSLESKVEELESKVNELEGGVDKFQYEASELKVKELEQKLELERSSARRHESQIHRLRNQLERLQEEKSEDVTRTSSDAIKRLQKQIRELRSEHQEAERREQDQSKKKRNAEGRVEELEAQLKNTEADLKSAQKRIETLHSALKSHEDYGSSGEDDEEYSRSNTGDDDLSSNASSYKIGEFGDDTGSLISNEEIEDLEGEGSSDNLISATYTSRSWKRRDNLSPIPSDEDYRSSREKKSKSRYSDEDQEEDEFISNYRKRNKDYLKELEDEEEKLDIKLSVSKTSKSSYTALPKEDDNDLSYKHHTVDDESKPLTSRAQEPSEPKDDSPKTKTSTSKDFDDEDEDDDDLEEFLLKQRERLRTTIDKVDDETRSHRSPARSSNPEDSPKQSSRQNGTRDSKSRSREPSADLLNDDQEQAQESKTARQRRSRQRRRTIEQLTSPEHQAASSNGVH